MAKAIMVQGTMSNAGKSLLCAGLCRVFQQDGYKVAPFKSQNMALNSFITKEGFEMGRAQAVQAEAAGVEPSVHMNPILLKPITNMGSQVIVMGETRGEMRARAYYAMKHTLVPEIMAAFDALAAAHDIIVIEGAGSPAELNLKKGDFVNMGMAKLAKAPVLLVGDIDRGGVFAQLYGTVALLDSDERDMVKATIVNKFRGDVTLFQNGISMLEELTGKPVAGVMPYLDVDIDDEDSLSDRLTRTDATAVLDIAVVRLPRITNFTDFAALEATGGVGVRYVHAPKELGAPDLLILPGTKNAVSDMKWLRESGLEAAIKKRVAQDMPVIGICGGYQMLGARLEDADGAIGGMALLPITTEISGQERRSRAVGKLREVGGALAALSGVSVEGYEIHAGRIVPLAGADALVESENSATDGCQNGSVYGTNLHGFFDSASCRERLIGALCARKGVTIEAGAFDLAAYRESQYDALAQGVRENLNMKLIYDILEAGI